MKNLLSDKIQKKDICCPHCGKTGTWTKDNTARPFCSPRCKLIDLGAWANEERSIPGETPIPQDDESDPAQ
jgi:endogenous inhibitor of DNA gyrase (YacG/DUF329 family)